MPSLMHLNPVGIRSTNEYQHAYPFIAVSLQIVPDGLAVILHISGFGMAVKLALLIRVLSRNEPKYYSINVSYSKRKYS